MRKQIKVVTLVGVAVVFTALSMMAPTSALAMDTPYWICQDDSVCGGCGTGTVCARKIIKREILWLEPCCFPTTLVLCKPGCTTEIPCNHLCYSPGPFDMSSETSEAFNPPAQSDHEPISPVGGDPSPEPLEPRDRHGVEDAAR